MVKVLNDYPQTVSISAANMTKARAWAKKMGYLPSTVESVGLSVKKRKAFFGTSSNVYVILKGAKKSKGKR